MGKGTFSIIVNQTEVKAKTPSTDSQFLIPGFPASKLRAEKMVLAAYGLQLRNGKGKVIKFTYRLEHDDDDGIKFRNYSRTDEDALSEFSEEHFFTIFLFRSRYSTKFYFDSHLYFNDRRNLPFSYYVSLLMAPNILFSARSVDVFPIFPSLLARVSKGRGEREGGMRNESLIVSC